ncbi:MAG TPA: thiamine phosphate synthase [Hyphomonas sp.]|nr:thiamine phosphate synthase [Hyphomonas sp.]HRJ00387.1 thiamine phosphate synthase [Hyphomonas sp.]HRK67068.1 thiamine phosphate synthase [Hyphomonas sp.]
MSQTPPPRPRTRLYLITPPQIPDAADFSKKLESAVAAGDIASLQLRLKGADGRVDEASTRAVSRAVTGLAQEAGIAVLINDSPELVRELGADGVHLGWDDMDIKSARKLLGPDAIIGATAKNSYHKAMQAGEDGADYVAFGAFYPTSTKDSTVPAEPELLEVWQAAMLIPCVAIGGITAANAAPLVRAGADFIAVSAGVWAHEEGPAAAVRAFNSLFDELA